MFCPNCGTQNADNTTFCKECGCRLDANGGFAGDPESVNYGDFNGNFGASPVPAEAKKSNKKTGIIIAVAIVLVAVIATCAIFVIPNIFGGSSKNPFSSASKHVDKDSSNYAALNTLSCAYNTVCNTKSVSVHAKDDNGTCDIKIELGNDLANSQAYVNIDNSAYCAIYGGEIILGEVDYGICLNFKEACKDSVGFVKSFMENSESDEYYDDYGKKTAEDIDNFVKGNNLNAEAIFDALNNFYLLMYAMHYDTKASYSDFSFEESMKSLAIIFEELPEDAMDVDIDKSGKKTSYEFSINGADFFDALIDYMKSGDEAKDNLKKSFGYDDEQLYSLFDSIEEELDEFEDENVIISATVEKNYLTEFTVEYDDEETFSIEFYDINKTTVEESDYKKVKKKLDDIDEYSDCEELFEDIF